MSLIFMSEREFVATSSDIVDNKIDGLAVVGARVFILDTQTWYIVKDDLTLSVYTLPSNGTPVSITQPVKFGDSPSIDAFARLRVSNPQTLFDSKNIYDDPGLSPDQENEPLYFDNAQVSGSGTSTGYNASESSQTMFVSENTAGRRVRQTKMRFNYQPGKSQMVLLTYNFDGLQSGITKREGIFDDNNGVFLQSVGENISFVVRSKASGSVIDTVIPQSQWNVDTMNGSGASGIDIDFEKTQILLIDYEWLGVGRVRVGFVIDGIPYYAHYFNHANNLPVVYMQTPNLPLRSEISNDGTGEESSITQICSTVISEGGSQELGSVRYISTGGTHVDANTENVIYTVLAMRLKSEYLGLSVKLLTSSIQVSTSSERVEWMIKLNPTVAGTLTYNPVAHSGIEYAIGATANTITGGYDLAGGFMDSSGGSAGGAGSLSSTLDNAILLGSTVAGVSDVIVLCVRPVAGSSSVDIEGCITFRELN